MILGGVYCDGGGGGVGIRVLGKCSMMWWRYIYTTFTVLSGRCLIECRDEYKYNVEAVELLIRNHLVNMQQYDVHLAQVSFWRALSTVPVS